MKNAAQPDIIVELDTGRAASRDGAGRTAQAWVSALYQSHCRALCAYLRRKYGPPPPEPEDIAQQAFTRLAGFGADQLVRIDNPKAFLYRIAENLLLNEKRGHAIRARHQADIKAAFLTNPGFDLDPESVLVGKEELALIEATIRAMPERRRQCFIMHRIDELSFAEIARRLGISPPASRAHVERALADIDAALTAYEKVEQDD